MLRWSGLLREAAEWASSPLSPRVNLEADERRNDCSYDSGYGLAVPGNGRRACCLQSTQAYTTLRAPASSVPAGRSHQGGHDQSLICLPCALAKEAPLRAGSPEWAYRGRDPYATRDEDRRADATFDHDRCSPHGSMWVRSTRLSHRSARLQPWRGRSARAHPNNTDINMRLARAWRDPAARRAHLS